MGLVRAMLIGASGLSAQRTRMEALTSNLVNAHTTRTAAGGPYRPLVTVFRAEPLPASFGDDLARALHAVTVERVAEDDRPPVLRYEPGHPDADAAGMVAYPDVEPLQVMIDVLSATRSYEANVTVVKTIRDMRRTTLEIIA